MPSTPQALTAEAARSRGVHWSGFEPTAAVELSPAQRAAQAEQIAAREAAWLISPGRQFLTAILAVEIAHPYEANEARNAWLRGEYLRAGEWLEGLSGPGLVDAISAVGRAAIAEMRTVLSGEAA
jgi:hypothetical protein